MSPNFPTSQAEKESFGEMGYYQDALQGVHQSLSFMGRPPLFILKDKWETTPPARQKAYYQVVDPRTQLFMDTEYIELQPVGLVQWKVPCTVPGLNFPELEEGKNEPEPEYMLKVAMTSADAMGVGEKEEDLDVVSSDDEEGIQLKKGKSKEDDTLTVYYPLIALPSKSRGKELREILKSLANETRGATGRFAKEWLDDIERVDKFPSIHNRE
ncbi:hypothetical protein OPQ81_011716 [Rhizoctonia solani]|nr:hypothetical protein OPQ81_011716 [Rhizoctonia solani]